jgi:hypothetical protein
MENATYDLGCRCSDPLEPRCGPHAREEWLRVQAQLTLALRGCVDCRPTSDASTLSKRLRRISTQWRESAEGRLVAAAHVEVLSPGPLRDLWSRRLDAGVRRYGESRSLLALRDQLRS